MDSVELNAGKQNGYQWGAIQQDTKEQEISPKIPNFHYRDVYNRISCLQTELKRTSKYGARKNYRGVPIKIFPASVP